MKFLYALTQTNIKIKNDKNVILLLENDLLFLKFRGRTILDFGKIFPKNDSILLMKKCRNNKKYTKGFCFFYFD